jgi:hypothetical protein
MLKMGRYLAFPARPATSNSPFKRNIPEAHSRVHARMTVGHTAKNKEVPIIAAKEFLTADQIDKGVSA